MALFTTNSMLKKRRGKGGHSLPPLNKGGYSQKSHVSSPEARDVLSNP